MESIGALLDFLHERKINEENISRIVADNIDASVIPLMSDNDLAKYIPRYGDRVAVVAFCRNHLSSVGEKTNRKRHLLEKVRSRLGILNATGKPNASQKHAGNMHAKKKAKRVELGWRNYTDNDFKQVRTAKGGGLRHVCLDIQTKVCEIKELAENLFFPNGKSKYLELKDVHTEIQDFAQRTIDENCTVEELYESTKVKLLRLYLFTWIRENVDSSEEMADTEALSPVPPPDCNQQSQDQKLVSVDLTGSTEPYFAEDLQVLMNEQVLAMQNDYMGELSEQKEEMSNEQDNMQAKAGSEQSMYASVQIENSFDEVIINGAFAGSESSSLDDTVPIEDIGNPTAVVEVRRGFALIDLMNAFGDPAIMAKEVSIQMKLPNGSFEEGVGTGVFRDCLTEFWNEFYSRCTVGTDVKAPFLRHEYQSHEWQAIARVLVKGWLAVGYFPIRLPLPFLEEALYGTTYSSIRDSFMCYISKSEREVLEQALHNFISVDQDALLDVLDSHECHQIPTEQNISPLLTQLGHKALIQTPMFVIESWRPILKDVAATLTPQRLAEIVQEQVPTPKRVKEILKFPESMNAAQTCVARHLKRYVGEMDDNTLRLFLRFCTGADLLIGSNITVEFIETSEFQCRPQAHTCGCYLMLPSNYQNYPDLRSDFSAILNSSVWVMDII